MTEKEEEAESVTDAITDCVKRERKALVTDVCFCYRQHGYTYQPGCRSQQGERVLLYTTYLKAGGGGGQAVEMKILTQTQTERSISFKELLLKSRFLSV